MKVTLAESAGFCFGVTKAVERLEKAVSDAEGTGKPVYTWGPIIHNTEVVRSFSERGVSILSSEDDLKNAAPGTVVIRAHGVPPAVYDLLERRGMTIVDGTCPFVHRIHETVSRESESGRQIVVIGDPNHPEVQGIVGWCGENPVSVVMTREEAEAFEPASEASVCVVSQTTFNLNKFKELVEIIGKKGYDSIVFNTICNATEQRQSEAAVLAANSDAMVVIGDSSSSNTQKLFEICKAQCGHTYHVQTADELKCSWFFGTDSLGITAGASTPNKIIQEVLGTCQKCQT